MVNYGQTFLNQLAACPAGSFENCFAMVSNKLGLGTLLERNELVLLHEAASRATLCNLAFNGLPRTESQPCPENENTRRELEIEFMMALDILFASPGWQNLAASDQKALRTIFLNVFVRPERLAPEPH